MKNFFERHSLLMISFATITAAIFVFMYFNKSTAVTYDRLPLSKKMELLENSWERYKSLTGIELHRRWHLRFGKSKYVLNGRAQRNEFDCSTSIYVFLTELGAAIKYENSTDMGKRLEYQSTKRSSRRHVKPSDLIIFHKDHNGIGHIGIVEGANYRKRITYMDINGKIGGVSYQDIKFNDSRIKGIYPVTFTFWAGDILK
jgi:hypothetical protein